MLLERINSPEDVKRLNGDEIHTLADEVRAEVLRVVSKNGGHLASNLGAVELTIAMHRVFDCPKDSFIFDVGHQSYVHKLLTGRREQFDTLRKFGGLSGFPRRDESVCDAFGAGHSSTSISAGVGIATANRLSGSDAYTVVVIGDGSFTGGMAYEALNNCAGNDKLIIILNDNNMSIAKNVGAMDTYLNRFRNSAKYFRLKNGVKNTFEKIPLCGKGLVRISKKAKNGLKRLLVRENFFEHLGLAYYGPLDGNDEQLLETVLREAKQDGKCSVVHVCTKKGLGYAPAEERPDLYHGTGPFDLEKGVSDTRKVCFSSVFGDALCELAGQDDKICAITAAMPDGTGLSTFAEKFPDRFFDVGIAEQHAATFACGLASKGFKPVFAVYSTFAQRAYDQIIHDCALQNLPVVFALDRAGLVGDDGPTHHGVFDVSFLNAIPGLTIYSPDSYDDLRDCLRKAVASGKPSVVRYSRSAEEVYPKSAFTELDGVRFMNFGKQPKVSIFTYGRLTANAMKAAAYLYEQGVQTRVIQLIRLKPILPDTIRMLTDSTKNLYFLEEGMREGGVSEALVAMMTERGYCVGKNVRIRAIDNRFVPHGSTDALYGTLGFLPKQIAGEITEMEEKICASTCF